MNGKKDLYHFVLSLVIVVGGGYLWATRADLAGEVGAVMGTVVGWWFGKAANGNGSGAVGRLNGSAPPKGD
jgi:hypothetical protein